MTQLPEMGLPEAVAWAAGLEANMGGYIDAMAWSEGEFTTPLYTRAQMIAFREADRVDAERYRWLRANVRWWPMPADTQGAVYLVASMVSAVYGNCDDQTDAAIDKARGVVPTDDGGG